MNVGQIDFAAEPAGPGTLVYLTGRSAASSFPIVWLDGSGKIEPLLSKPGHYNMPRFSPDGQQLAVASEAGAEVGIWTYDLKRDSMTRLTFSGRAGHPVWTPDGKHIIFQLFTPSGYFIQWIRADGAGETQTLWKSTTQHRPASLTPDGRYLAFTNLDPHTNYDIWTVPLDLSDPERNRARRSHFCARRPMRGCLHFPQMGAGWRTLPANRVGMKFTCVHSPDREENGRFQPRVEYIRSGRVTGAICFSRRRITALWLLTTQPGKIRFPLASRAAGLRRRFSLPMVQGSPMRTWHRTGNTLQCFRQQMPTARAKAQCTPCSCLTSSTI